MRNKIAFNGMFWDVHFIVDTSYCIFTYNILWVLNAILFSAAFRHIPFGCESPPVADGQAKVQRTLNRSEAEFDEVNVPE